MEVTVQANNVRVEQVELDIDLSAQLHRRTRNVGVLLFAHAFEGENEFALLFARQVHTSKLAIAERLANFKVVDGPFLPTFRFGA